MRQQANADMELSCDDMVLDNMSFEYRKAYSEMVFGMIKHQKTNGLTTNFFGGARVMKERFQNILNVEKKRNGWIIFSCICITSIFASSFVAFTPAFRQSDISTTTANVRKNHNYKEMEKNLTSDESMESIIKFSKDFINLFNGAVANQATVSFEDYISNATGHIMERKVNNTELWNDEHWVNSVFENMLAYDAKLEEQAKRKK